MDLLRYYKGPHRINTLITWDELTEQERANYDEYIAQLDRSSSEYTHLSAISREEMRWVFRIEDVAQDEELEYEIERYRHDPRILDILEHIQGAKGFVNVSMPDIQKNMEIAAALYSLSSGTDFPVLRITIHQTPILAYYRGYYREGQVLFYQELTHKEQQAILESNQYTSEELEESRWFLEVVSFPTEEPKEYEAIQRLQITHKKEIQRARKVLRERGFSDVPSSGGIVWAALLEESGANFLPKLTLDSMRPLWYILPSTATPLYKGKLPRAERETFKRSKLQRDRQRKMEDIQDVEYTEELETPSRSETKRTLQSFIEGLEDVEKDVAQSSFGYQSSIVPIVLFPRTGSFDIKSPQFLRDLMRTAEIRLREYAYLRFNDKANLEHQTLTLPPELSMNEETIKEYIEYRNSTLHSEIIYHHLSSDHATLHLFDLIPGGLFTAESIDRMRQLHYKPILFTYRSPEHVAPVIYWPERREIEFWDTGPLGSDYSGIMEAIRDVFIAYLHVDSIRITDTAPDFYVQEDDIIEYGTKEKPSCDVYCQVWAFYYMYARVVLACDPKEINSVLKNKSLYERFDQIKTFYELLMTGGGDLRRFFGR